MFYGFTNKLVVFHPLQPDTDLTIKDNEEFCSFSMVMIAPDRICGGGDDVYFTPSAEVDNSVYGAPVVFKGKYRSTSLSIGDFTLNVFLKASGLSPLNKIGLQ